MPKPLLAVASLVLLALAGPTAADEAEDVIKYRQAWMKALGGHMAAMAQIVRGKVSYPAHLEGHARATSELSKDVVALFPEGSDFGETGAKPEIWKERAKFEKAADDARKAGEGLLAAVKAGEGAGIGKAFEALSEACKSCHEDFREKE